MKRLVFIAIAAIFCFGLIFVGCGDGSGDGNEWDDSWDERHYKSASDGFAELFIEKGDNFIAYYDGWVYVKCWHNADDLSEIVGASEEAVPNEVSSIYRMRKNGEDKEKMPDDCDISARGYFLDGWIYYSDNSMRLYRVRTDGLQKQQLSSLPVSEDFVIRGDRLYFSDFVSLKLYRMKTDGSDLQELSERCLGFIVESGYIFMLEGPGNTNLYRIFRLNLNGSDKKLLVGETHSDISLRFTRDGYFYYSESQYFEVNGFKEGGKMYRMLLDGSDCVAEIAMENNVGLVKIDYKDDFWFFERQFKEGSSYINEICKMKSNESGYDKISDGWGAGLLEIFDEGILYQAYDRDFNCQTIFDDLGGEPVLLHDSQSESGFKGYFSHENKLFLVLSEK